MFGCTNSSKCIMRNVDEVLFYISLACDLKIKLRNTSSRLKDGQLTVGENSCIDRCSSKYWQV